MKLITLFLTVLIAACSANGPQVPSASIMIGKQRAILIAKRELIRRNLRLPKGARIVVSGGFAFDEVNPRRPIYVVSFFWPDPHRRIAMYNIDINSSTGGVEGFTDTRTVIPAGL